MPTRQSLFRPLSIKLIVGFFIMTAAFLLFPILRMGYAQMRTGTPLFAKIPVSYFYTPMLHCLLAVGIWRLLNIVRLLTMAYLAYLLLRLCQSTLIYGKHLVELMKQLASHGYTPAMRLELFTTVPFLIFMVCNGLTIWFLWKRRSAFLR